MSHAADPADTLDGLANRLTDALAAFDWDTADQVCEEVVQALSAPFSPARVESAARRMLDGLRRKRRFEWLERLAGAFLLSGLRAPRVRRLYAQALIDQRRYAAAEQVLVALRGDAGASEAERAEAHGLTGRLWKQLYVAPGRGAPGPRPDYLQRAIAAYWTGADGRPHERVWHAINVVALLARAERDGVPLDESYPPWRELAGGIVRAIDDREAAATGSLPAFDLATRMEALVALDHWDAAERAAATYVRCADADAFELGSTVRQLEQVWGISSVTSGAVLLSILHASLLGQDGGAVRLTGEATRGERRAAGSAGDGRLEAVLGADRSRTLAWYKGGLERCASVARIETRSGRGFGTGWLVRGSDLAARWGNETLLITNKHVVSPGLDDRPYMPAPSHEALLPHDAIVYLQMHGVRLEIAEVVWTSPDLELDATLVRVRDLPADARPLPLYPQPIVMREPPARVYVIGHPAGRDLELSLHDNVMLDCDARRLHYRAPTEGGSSGSPVFDDLGWRVVGLHHAGGRGVVRITGEGRYDANEGIVIDALRKAMA